ncbi:enoyl-ACP reductase 2 [Artemisia annua]|uniref:Enoyl-ACP reductase 2 n=1 Tax=Artemisia annua TaxID=35608 RepID=A0A2U1KY72_ARTAN|nr:enoyl-ACP reductase 2 [Artemisia annua]
MVQALNIFETNLRRGKFDESRVLPDGSLMNITKVYPLDAVYDTPEDVPNDVKSNKRYAGYSNWTVKEVAESVKQDFGSIDILMHSLANGPEVTKRLIETSRQGYLVAISASSYSFISLLQHFVPIMNPEGVSLLGNGSKALNIFETNLRRGKFDESRVLPDGSLMNITKVYPLDAVYDTPEDVPNDVKSNKRYAGYSNWTVKEVAESVKQDFGSIDILMHSLANGPEVTKRLIETSRQGYLAAISASSYSFISLLQHFVPIMNPGSTSVSLTAFPSQRVLPGYGGGMSSAKAALESDTKVSTHISNIRSFIQVLLSFSHYNKRAQVLAFEAGRKHRIRVNTISAGSLRSRAAKATGIIDMMIDYSLENAPLQKELLAEEVGNAAAFLASPLASAITGTVLYVDNGLNTMGVAVDSPVFTNSDGPSIILNPTPRSRYNPYDERKAKKARKKSGNVEVNTPVVQLKAPTVVKEIEKVPDFCGSVISSVVSDLANEIAPSVDVDKESVVMSVKPADVDLASKKDDVVVADVDNAMVLVEKATGSVHVEKGTSSVENVTAGVSKPKKSNVVVTDVVDKRLRLNVKGPSKASVEAVSEKDEPSKVVLTKDKPKHNPLKKDKKAKKARKKSGNVEVNTPVVQLKASTVVKEIEKVPDFCGSVISSVVSDLANEIAPSVDVDKESVVMSVKPADVDLASKKDDVVVGKSSGLVYEKRNSNRRKATGSVDKATGSADVDNAMVLVEKATGSVHVEKGTGSVENVTAGVSKPKKSNVVVTDVVDKRLRLNVKGPSKASVEAVSEKDEPSKVVLTKDKPKHNPLKKDKSVSEEAKPKRKLALSKGDQIKKKPKLVLEKDADEKKKRKRGDSVKEEDILPEGVIKQFVNKLLKSSLVKAETDEEDESKPSKKGKKKEKKFLVEIGFGSYVRFDITKIPGRLGRYVVHNFDAETCRLKLERERFIEVTVTKVHELLGIPIGGQSLLTLETRPVGDDFEKVWLGQFEGKSAKQLRVNDIANKLIESKEVDWCDYIFHCLKLSKKPSTLQNKYSGPYTLLARHDMELKEEYFGMSELYDESELSETEGFVVGCSSSYKKDLLKNLEEKLAAISNEIACF